MNIVKNLNENKPVLGPYQKQTLQVLLTVLMITPSPSQTTGKIQFLVNRVRNLLDVDIITS